MNKHLNKYQVFYYDRDKGAKIVKNFYALSISHLIDVMQNKIGYVPEVDHVNKLPVTLTQQERDDYQNFYHS